MNTFGSFQDCKYKNLNFAYAKLRRTHGFYIIDGNSERALGGSGDIGVVYIIGAPHPELLPKTFCQKPLIFDRLNNQACSKWAYIIFM